MSFSITFSKVLLNNSLEYQFSIQELLKLFDYLILFPENLSMAHFKQHNFPCQQTGK